MPILIYPSIIYIVLSLIFYSSSAGLVPSITTNNTMFPRP